MTKVYGYMCLGLIVSAVAAWVFAYVPEFNQFLYTPDENGMATLSIAGWIVLLAPLLMLLAAGFINDMDSGATFIFFIVFSLLMGASLRETSPAKEVPSSLQTFMELSQTRKSGHFLEFGERSILQLASPLATAVACSWRTRQMRSSSNESDQIKSDPRSTVAL